MSEFTGIEWTDHTFNPWWGCAKVSEACIFCYAEEWAGRFPKTQGLWGADAGRKIASEKVWGDPIRWNRAAEKAGARRRVFCASMADVFEARDDLDEHRSRLFGLIRETPSLDWLLLTKRPEQIRPRTPPSWWLRGFPANVWMGATVESQEQAEKRIPHLIGIPARVRFLSCEPLLGPVVLADACNDWLNDEPGIDWVIVGGESGSTSRPMHIEWARSLRDQCDGALVPFFFKQWGESVPTDQLTEEAWVNVDARHNLTNGDFSRTRWKLGKKLAGSLLDGVNHKAFPVRSW